MRLLTFPAPYLGLVEQGCVREVEAARRDATTRDYPDFMRDHDCHGEAIVIILAPTDSFHDAAKALYQAIGPSKPAPRISG